MNFSLIPFTSAAPPRFLEDTEEVLYLNVGQSHAFELPFSANPMPKVTWTYNDKSAMPNIKRIKHETIYGMTSMTMAKVVRTDSGDYKVSMENDYGSASFTLKVIVKGEIHDTRIFM